MEIDRGQVRKLIKTVNSKTSIVCRVTIYFSSVDNICGHLEKYCACRF